MLRGKSNRLYLFMTENELLEINIPIALNRLLNAIDYELLSDYLLPESEEYDWQRNDRIESVVKALVKRGHATQDQDLITLTESCRNILKA